MLRNLCVLRTLKQFWKASSDRLDKVGGLMDYVPKTVQRVLQNCTTVWTVCIDRIWKGRIWCNSHQILGCYHDAKFYLCSDVKFFYFNIEPCIHQCLDKNWTQQQIPLPCAQLPIRCHSDRCRNQQYSCNAYEYFWGRISRNLDNSAICLIDAVWNVNTFSYHNHHMDKHWDPDIHLDQDKVQVD